MKYTWDDLYDRADGAAFGEDTLKAKDEARWQVRCFAMELGEDDLENAGCPEDTVEDYCKKYDIWFDERGNIIKTNASKWTNIANDLTDGTETIISAWSIYDICEDSKTIAIVNNKTGKVEYYDEDAKTDKYAQRKINEVLENLKTIITVTIEVYDNSTIRDIENIIGETLDYHGVECTYNVEKSTSK